MISEWWLHASSWQQAMARLMWLRQGPGLGERGGASGSVCEYDSRAGPDPKVLRVAGENSSSGGQINMSVHYREITLLSTGGKFYDKPVG